MSINEVGNLKGRKVISSKVGSQTIAKQSHGDKANTHASSHTSKKVPVGSQNHTHPTLADNKKDGESIFN